MIRDLEESWGSGSISDKKCEGSNLSGFLELMVTGYYETIKTACYKKYEGRNRKEI